MFYVIKIYWQIFMYTLLYLVPLDSLFTLGKFASLTNLYKKCHCNLNSSRAHHLQQKS